MVGSRIVIKKKTRSNWLTNLLKSEFFGSCGLHLYLRKNEENLFCIDCSHGLCKHCMDGPGHGLHRRLQICKYVYQDVVRLPELQKHLDCSQIQTYKINGEKAVHLNPRPQSKDGKPSTKSKNKGTCEACGRYIQDLPNRFCSVACKVLALSLKPKDQRHDFITFSGVECTDLSLKENSSTIYDAEDGSCSSSWAESENRSRVGPALRPRKPLCKRKGVPCRAPLQ